MHIICTYDITITPIKYSLIYMHEDLTACDAIAAYDVISFLSNW